jgi:hypothetical protein
MCTFCSSPIAHHVANIDEPPYDTNISGRPGHRHDPIVMPMLTKAWKANQDTTRPRPALRTVPGVGRDPQAAPDDESQHQQDDPAPAKPSSSPATVKTKSVCCSGTYSPRSACP